MTNINRLRTRLRHTVTAASFFLTAGTANAAVNYLVLTGTTGFDANVPSVTLKASISTTCPLVSGAGNGFMYFGIQIPQLATASMLWSVIPYGVAWADPWLSGGTACLAGVPSAITLSSLGLLGLSSIALNVGGPTKSLSATYVNTSGGNSGMAAGIALPDNTIISIWASINGTGNWYGFGRFSGMSPAMETSGRGLLCSGVGGTSCANYIMGY